MSATLRVLAAAFTLALGPAAAARGAKPSASAAAITASLSACRFHEADSLARVHLARVERQRGPRAIETAEALGWVVEASFGAARPADEVLPLAGRCVAIRVERQGPTHPDVATSLLALGRWLVAAGRFDSARVVSERAVAIRRERFGAYDGRVAGAIAIGEGADDVQRDYRTETRRAEEAMGILARASKVDSLDAAYVCAALGSGYLGLRDADRARPVLERALRLKTTTLCLGHPDRPAAFQQLALVHRMQEDFPEARRLNDLALAEAERIYGPDHLKLCPMLVNQSRVLVDLGEYVEARQLAERALAIRERQLGPGDPLVGSALQMMEYVLSACGDFAAATPYMERALAINRRYPGPDSIELARALNLQGSLLVNLGRPREARAFFEEGLALSTRRKGAEDPGSLYLRGRIAETLAFEGRLDEARQIYAGVAVSQERKASPLTWARTLYALAELDRALGAHDEALALHERALAIRDSLVGPLSPDALESRVTLAALRYERGDREPAFALAMGVEEDTREQLRLAASRFAEREALAFERARASGIAVLMSLASDSIGVTAAERLRVLDAVARSRLVVLDELADEHRALARDQATLAPWIRELDEARAALALEMVNALRNDRAPDSALAIARARREAAERALAERSSGFRAAMGRSEAGIERIAKSLPEGGALVSYVRFEGPAPVFTANPGAPPARRLAAFVLRRGSAAPACVALPAPDAFGGVLDQWVTACATPPAEAIAHAAQRRCDALGREVRRRWWDPVAKLARGADRVFVVPDAELHAINFMALPEPQGYLADSGPVIHRLTAERDLLPWPGSARDGGLLVVGGVDFDRAEAAGAPVATLTLEPASVGPASALRVSELDSGRVHFAPLPHTREEADEVAQAWNQHVAEGSGPAAELVGAEAGEGAFKRLVAGRRMLHVATHGFVLGAGGTSTQGLRGVGGVTAGGASRAAGDRSALLPGLAFAGANRPPAAGAEDGFLTAEEITALPLDGVEWAVLSACETGLSDPAAVEVVQGLHRAFRRAGVRTVIMSLWSVDDASTSAWMRQLYAARLSRRLETDQAVRSACRSLLAERRHRGLDTHPFHWAAFVASGDWR